MKQKMVAMSVFAILLLSSVIAVSEPATESDENGTSQTLQSIVKIWEAYAKGWVEITSENVSYYGYPSPLVFRVNNTRDVNVNINEMVVLMSPHPLQTGDPQTTQDGALTNAVVAPNSVEDFYYGEMTLPGEYFAGEKPWWCTEARQVTQDGATLVLGGEIMPIPLQGLIKNPDQYTNSRIWSYLYQNPMLVVGKTPLWKEIPDATNVYVDTTIAVTNLAVYNGSLVPDPPHARNSVIEDILPKDYSYDPVSFDPAPDTIISNPDGTKTIRWSVDVDAADVGTHLYLDPTPYHTVFLNYTLITPKLSVGRYFLERAWADVDHDGTNDSYSARPLLEVFWVNKPPIPNAGGPYIASEGEIVHFDASGTYDADGDPLQYMWDIDGDGIFETNYSSSPLFDFTLGDDFIGMARLRVTDGTHEVETVASLTINNVAPTIEGIDWSAQVRGEPRTQGYWNFQCTEKLPSPDHVGIRQEFIDYISSNSQVFSGISTKDEVCDYLGNLDSSNMTQKAMQQLMALWLNVASGKLNLSSEAFVTQLNMTMTLLEIITWIEQTILGDNQDDMEVAKDLADAINNGQLLLGSMMTVTVTASDPGSDDLIFTWDWGDGSSESHIYYNNGMSPDPYPSTDVNPISIIDVAGHSYLAPGSYVITLEVRDDDSGQTFYYLNVDIH